MPQNQLSRPEFKTRVVLKYKNQKDQYCRLLQGDKAWLIICGKYVLAGNPMGIV